MMAKPGRVIIDELPLNLPSIDKFSLKSLYLSCLLFDIEIENVLPKSGKFYLSDQPWNVEVFYLTVNRLYINVE